MLMIKKILIVIDFHIQVFVDVLLIVCFKVFRLLKLFLDYILVIMWVGSKLSIF